MANGYPARLFQFSVERLPAGAFLTASGKAVVRRIIEEGLDRIDATESDFEALSEALEELLKRAAELSLEIDAEVLREVLAESSDDPPRLRQFFGISQDFESAVPDVELDGESFFRGRRSSREQSEEEAYEWSPAPLSPRPVPRMEEETSGAEPPIEAAERHEMDAPGASDEPPRKAWPRLDAPDIAVEGRAIQVVVGLRKDPDPEITGEAIERPQDKRGPYFLTVHLVADGFKLETGETFRRTLAVTADEAYPTTTFTLTPVAEAAPMRPERLVAYYSVDGQTIGQAVRAVVVVHSDAQVDDTAPPAQPAGRTFSKPAAVEAVDLEVRVTYSEQRHRLLWTFSSRYALPNLPDEPPSTELGDEPEAFGQLLIRDLEEVKKADIALNRLRGLGRIVRDHLPAEFWPLLSAAADAAKASRGAERPAILILSEEPYVPWELAYFDAPLVDEDAPPYLNLQVDVGRWSLDADQSDVQIARRRAVDSFAAITGTYDHPRWSDLAEAKAEARTLADLYGAEEIDAEVDRVLQLCSDNPELPDVLHFAVHGKYSPGQSGRGLVLLDGDSIHYLTDTDVRGFSLETGPFVFLNACQIGSSNELLGNYAGLAHSFLAAGASGVIAPLWSVNDRVARELALSFYQEVAAGKPAVEALRAARLHSIESAPTDASAIAVTTPFAYLYYGHPELLFGWQLESTT